MFLQDVAIGDGIIPISFARNNLLLLIYCHIVSCDIVKNVQLPSSFQSISWSQDKLWKAYGIPCRQHFILFSNEIYSKL